MAACPSVQILALQPHLHIEFEVIFLAVRAYGIVDFKLLIVFVHFEFAAGASFSQDRSGEPDGGAAFCLAIPLLDNEASAMIERERQSA